MGTPQQSLQDALSKIAELEARFATEQSNYEAAMDTTWTLLTGYLVWIMAAGFCFLEMGSVRYKNAQNILTKNIIVPVIAFLCWWATGYGFAFGADGMQSRFAGSRYFFMNGFWEQKGRLRHWFFQGCFCDTSASIVSGGTAERMTLFGFMAHTMLFSCFVYPLCVYWAWSGNGWLSYSGEDGQLRSVVGPAYLDWAGSGVIHLVGGTAAFIGAIVVGPRKGRFDGADEEEFMPHSMPFTVLGTFILWFGWYGFNPGCVQNMHTAQGANSAALAAVNTTLAPCVAGLVAFILKSVVLPPRRFDVGALCNGILGGCVAITAGCGYVKAWEALVIGFISGLLYVGNAALLPRLKVDDPIEAISVHFVNGLWGAIAVGLFGDPKAGIGANGSFYGGDQLGVQLLACVVFMLWSAAWSLVIFLPLAHLKLLRWTDELQDLGADEVQHSPKRSMSTPDCSPSKDFLAVPSGSSNLKVLSLK